MKLLALCSAGTVRSGGLVLAAKRQGIDALQAGIHHNRPETVAMLSAWADVILVAETNFILAVPEEHRGKVIDSGLGGDRWQNPLHPELGPLCDEVIHQVIMRT